MDVEEERVRSGEGYKVFSRGVAALEAERMRECLDRKVCTAFGSGASSLAGGERELEGKHTELVASTFCPSIASPLSVWPPTCLW